MDIGSRELSTIMECGDVIDVDGELRMYYVGFGNEAKFYIRWLSHKTDGGRSFVRKFKTQLLIVTWQVVYRSHSFHQAFIRWVLQSMVLRGVFMGNHFWEVLHNIAVVDSPDGFRFDANQGAAVSRAKEISSALQSL